MEHHLGSLDAAIYYQLEGLYTVDFEQNGEGVESIRNQEQSIADRQG